MKMTRLVSILSLCVLLGTLMGMAEAFETPESIVAAGNVYVSDVIYDPAVFFPGDVGTVTIGITNGNSDTGVVVNHAMLSDTTIKSTSRPYDTSSNIGPLQKKSYIFSVVADGFEGDYYPTFSLSFRDADSLFYRSRLRIDSTPLVLTILDKPDTFTSGKKKTIYAQVANPRENTVKNGIIDISGPGITAAPAQVFIGDLVTGVKVPVNFSVTPEQPTTLRITLSYNNGNNRHTVITDMPIIFGIDKKQANPVVSNVQVKNDAGTYHITGDVNNAGLETANTVMVTALSPAIPQDPYKTYVVGALKPDDFGSFEVTFSSTSAESIPLQLSYKDSDGNVYTSVQDVNIGLTGANNKTNTGPPLIPILAGLILVAVFVGGWIFYLRRNKK